MKAYIVNDTEFYAANHAPEAAMLHYVITQDDEMDIRLADLDAPWKSTDGEPPDSTVGAELAKATAPGWMGSTEA